MSMGINASFWAKTMFTVSSIYAGFYFLLHVFKGGHEIQQINPSWIKDSIEIDRQ